MVENESSIQSQPTLQNIRVGDKLGQRITGLGATFDLGSELTKSETLGFPTFEAIYLREYPGEEMVRLMKVFPDGKAGFIWGWDDVMYYEEISFDDPKNVKFIIDAADRNKEIVVIPNFSSISKETLKSLPENSIQDEFESKLKNSYKKVFGVWVKSEAQL